MESNSAEAAAPAKKEEQTVVFITGCTAGGIGHALALVFAKRGCRVIATARSVSSISIENEAVTSLKMDVLSEESVRGAVNKAIQAHGHIDILINNAGVHCVAPLAEIPISLLESTFSTNVVGLMRVITEVVPHMIARRKGKIVNVGSVTALYPSPWCGAYAASKAAVHSISDALRVELKPFGIDVITIAPGAIRSNIGANSTKIYETLPELRLYKPFEEAIRRRTIFSQEAGCTPADVFAAKTADVILRKESPAWFSYGKFSTAISIISYLPLWVKDLIARKKFQIHL